MALDFSQISGDMNLRDEMVERATKILQHEKIEVTQSQIKTVVSADFPDMRKVLKNLQFQFGFKAA
jgi:uncharacterized protein YqgV (UPF0045/DUF77 family)